MHTTFDLSHYFIEDTNHLISFVSHFSYTVHPSIYIFYISYLYNSFLYSVFVYTIELQKCVRIICPSECFVTHM